MDWSLRQNRGRRQVKPDDHSEVVPLLPIPNRTVKRLSADDSADSRVKVGHCQANIRGKPDSGMSRAFLLFRSNLPQWWAHSLRPGDHGYSLFVSAALALLD